MASFKDVTPPAGGQAISISAGKMQVPDHPIIPFIEGDGTGPDIWRASQRVFDAAVEKAYRGKRKIAWMEVFAGEKSKNKFDNWLPDDTVEAFRTFLGGNTREDRRRRRRCWIFSAGNSQRNSKKCVLGQRGRCRAGKWRPAGKMARRWRWGLGSSRLAAWDRSD